MYNPKGSDTGREWVEVYNYGDCSVSLEGWYFSDKTGNHKLKLKQGSWVLQPNDFAIISNNATLFFLEHKNFGKTVFQASFSLLNSGEEICLKDKSKNVADKTVYNSSLGANGNGKTLEFKEGGWVESYAEGGTPGEPNTDAPVKTERIKSIGGVGMFLPQQSLNQSENETAKKEKTLGMVSNEANTKSIKNITSNNPAKNATSREKVARERSLTGRFVLPSEPSLAISITCLGGLIYLFFRFFKASKPKA